jgi:hypothetical protein
VTRSKKRLLTAIAAVGVGVILLDALGYFALPDRYLKPFPGYRRAGTGWPRDYYRADPVRGFDIKPHARGIHELIDGPHYDVFANGLGCYDRENREDFLNGPWAYFAGDSFTWGYASYDKRFATQFQAKTGVPSAKCGVPHTGTRHQFDKFKSVVQDVGRYPALVVVGFYDNDLQNDYAHPHRTVIDGWPIDTAYVVKPGTLSLVRPPIAVLQADIRPSLPPSPDDHTPDAFYRAVRAKLRRYSLTANLVAYARRSTQPTQEQFGDDIYALSDPGFPPPLNADAVRIEGSELAGPTRRVIGEWAADAREYGYTLLFMFIPPKWFHAKPGRYAELTTLLDSVQVPHLVLAEAFRRSNLPADVLYWPNDEHLNDDGQTVAANELASWYTDWQRHQSH